MIPKYPLKLQEATHKKHKDKQIYLYDLYEPFNQKKANATLNCATQMWFLDKEHIKTKERKLFLENMYTCKDRFCNYCNWRREMKYKKLTYQFIDELHRTKRLRYIFLTLTVPNCHINDLRATIQHMSESFDRLKKRNKWKNGIVGYLRALEYTVQKDDSNMFHPHFHCMLAVEPAYFSPDRDLYISQEEFLQLWRKSTRDESIKSVDIRVVKPDKYRKTRPSVIAEMIKYTMKDTDLKKVANFEELTKQLKGVRTFNAGGILKEILKKTNKIDDDLVHIEDEVDADELWIVLNRVLYEYEIRDKKRDYYFKKVTKLKEVK